ncbi:MAG TPA: hypothetical protein VN493_10855 [Thermoanaerobaculia bacterium]|nr:hypothetical protein [Thermoanaerobaculia bacterium]
MDPRVDLGLNAVIAAVTAAATEEVPRILTVRRAPPGGGPAEDTLPFGPLEPDLDRTLDRGLRRWVTEQTGLPLGYVEQLYTFGDRGRDPAESHGGPRAVSVAYLALVREASVKGEASWRDWYEFFPWEDWRDGRPRVLDREVAPALEAWVAEAPDLPHRQERRERADIVFGLGGVAWDGERVLERYELLYEALLVPEAWRDRGEAPSPGAHRREDCLPGRPMALDHRRILATALGRLRGKIKYRPVVFELLPPTFTLLQLQRVVEALAGVRIHKQNFRRLVEHGGLVEGTGQDVQTGGRPAELFVFRRDVLRERPAPGVGVPGVRR